MKDLMYLGTTPGEEVCAQVGSADYEERAQAEARAYIHQLRRVFGPEPDGARFTIRWAPHDFGRYAEVICAFDDGCPEAVDYAYRVEKDEPAEWDDAARDELRTAGVCAIRGCDHSTWLCIQHRSDDGERHA